MSPQTSLSNRFSHRASAISFLSCSKDWGSVTMALASGAPGDHIKGAACLAPGSLVHLPMQIWALIEEIQDALSSLPNTTHFYLGPKAAHLVYSTQKSLIKSVSSSCPNHLSYPASNSRPHTEPNQNPTPITHSKRQPLKESVFLIHSQANNIYSHPHLKIKDIQRDREKAGYFPELQDASAHNFTSQWLSVSGSIWQ